MLGIPPVILALGALLVVVAGALALALIKPIPSRRRLSFEPSLAAPATPVPTEFKLGNLHIAAADTGRRH